MICTHQFSAESEWQEKKCQMFLLISTTDSSASFVISPNDFSLSSAEIIFLSGMISDTVSNVAACFLKCFALANKANASISAAKQLFSATILGIAGSIL